MRNVLMHGYFGFDLQEVWVAVERDLPKPRNQLKAILDAVNGSEQ